MFTKTVSFGYEFELSWNISLIPSLAYRQIQYSHNNQAGQNVFSKNNFSSLPVTLRKYFNVSNKSRLFLDFGLYASYFYLIKDEVRDGISPLLRIKKKNIGLNYGSIFAMGFKSEFNSKQSFDISIFSETDFIADKKTADWLKNNCISFLLSYYWAFN